MRTLLRACFICLSCLFLFCRCEKIQVLENDVLALEQDVADLKERIALQELLLQAVLNDKATVEVVSISASDDIYKIIFSNGTSLLIHTNVIPLIYIGNNGHWFVNGKDLGINALENGFSSLINIVDGYWYINGKNTGVKAEGKDGRDGNNGEDGQDGSDGKDGTYITRIIEFADYWEFVFSDETCIKVNKTQLSYSVENCIVKSFLSEIEYDSSDYSYSMISSYSTIETDYRKDLPAPILIEWGNYNYDNQELQPIKKEVVITDNNGFYYKEDVSIKDNGIYISNLAPGIDYCIKVRDYFSDGSNHVIQSKILALEGQIRMLNIDGDGIGNFRDLGGWKTTNGKRVKYGRLIRGGEVDFENSPIRRISELGIHQLVDILGLNVELDFGSFSSSSPLSKHGVTLYSGPLYQIRSYTGGLYNSANRELYANCLSIIFKELSAGKNIFFHCDYGADRSGTLAFLIEGLLGVSESDLSKDYELTSFSQFGERRRSGDDYSKFITFIKDNYDGSSISEKIESLALKPLIEGGLGLSEEAIVLFRREMLCNSQ